MPLERAQDVQHADGPALALVETVNLVARDWCLVFLGQCGKGRVAYCAEQVAMEFDLRHRAEECALRVADRTADRRRGDVAEFG
ncbi:MAG TPA: hypothetical protein VNJ10_07575 [Sphingomonas sp.]|nr:hypothetical protein [Sphingomonas sp.]